MTLNIENPAAKTDGSRQTLLMVSTRKGAWFYYGDSARQTWRTDGPHFLGHIINHLLLDPRDGRTLLAAAKTGHLGRKPPSHRLLLRSPTVAADGPSITPSG